MIAGTVYYRAPFTIALYALDIEAEHMPTLQNRMAYGGFCPRTLFSQRPELWRYVPREAEPKDAPGNVHEWELVTT